MDRLPLEKNEKIGSFGGPPIIILLCYRNDCKSTIFLVTWASLSLCESVSFVPNSRKLASPKCNFRISPSFQLVGCPIIVGPYASKNGQASIKHLPYVHTYPFESVYPKGA